MNNKHIKQFLTPLLALIIVSTIIVSTITVYFSKNTLNNVLLSDQFKLLDTLNKEVLTNQIIQETEKLYLLIILTAIVFIIVGILVFIKIYKQMKIYTEDIMNNQKELEIAQSVANMGSWILDVEKNELLWSKQSYIIFEADYQKKNLTSDSFMSFIHPEDQQLVKDNLEKSVREHSPFHLVHRLLLKSGKEKVVEAKGEVSYPKDKFGNEKVIFNGTVQDITIKFNKDRELKEKEKLLVDQSKLASMGEMIGNIAHQWRQPLSIISTASTGIIVEKEYGLLDDDKLINNCNIINDNAQYLSKTIDDFRNFAKGDRIKKFFNLKDDISSFIHLVEGSITNHNISLIVDGKDDIQINGYENELIQCFINIFNNAKDALNENSSSAFKKLIFISTSLKEKNAVISFKDNGGGIPEDVISHIFEPYFTTKHKSQGTGLGLHMTYELIVEGMCGSIEAQNVNYTYENEKCKGAEFIITLPLN